MVSPEKWTPWVTLTTPSVRLPYFVQSLVVHKAEAAHQWAQLTVRYYMPPQYEPVMDQLPPDVWWAEDVPVSLTYGGTRSAPAQFVGYVVSPELVTDASGDEPYFPGQTFMVRYTLLGATKHMQTAHVRTWHSCTAAYMAQELAEENRLSSAVGRHPRVFTTRQQTQSDFAFLQARASEVGWRLAVEGTTLYCTDPRQRLVSRIPTFTAQGTAGLQDTLMNFQAVVGETDPAGSVRAQHDASVLSAAGVVSSASASLGESAPLLRRYDTQHVAASYAEVAHITQAAASRDVWWVQASATVDGDVTLRPGSVVSLGGPALTAQYQGPWMTRTAHHRLEISAKSDRLSTYYVDVELARDQSSGLTQLDMPVPQLSGSRLANGRWVAA